MEKEHADEVSSQKELVAIKIKKQGDLLLEIVILHMYLFHSLRSCTLCPPDIRTLILSE